jgi:hypothetical protein
MAQPSQPLNAYQLRLLLVGVSPVVWRRLLVSSETSIAQLHEYIQTCFEWSGEHLHRFHIQGKDYGISYVGGIIFDDNPHTVPLSRFRLHRQERFRYEYDFTAGWQMDIRLEKTLPLNPHGIIPLCNGGRGVAPGEEYAGALAYLQRLDCHRYGFPSEELDKMAEAMQRWLDSGGSRQSLGDLAELREAVGHVKVYQEFQARGFDRRTVNQRLLTASASQGAAA